MRFTGLGLPKEITLDKVDPHLLRDGELSVRLDSFGDNASGRVVPQALHHVARKVPELFGRHGL